MFQSRNRDAFHFRNRRCSASRASAAVSISQSRCFSFQVADRDNRTDELGKFQYRNRDAFHFRLTNIRRRRKPSGTGFNLAIEMLFISGPRYTPPDRTPDEKFQSRNRDAFHIRLDCQALSASGLRVSISQSRCFSYQA